MEYRVIHDSDMNALMKVVSARLSEGWQPCGGIAVVLSTPEGTNKAIDYYYQAITKPAESEFQFA